MLGIQAGAVAAAAAAADDANMGVKGVPGGDKGGKRGRGKASSRPRQADDDDGVGAGGEAGVAADADAWLRQHKAARRRVLHWLFLGDVRYQKAITEPFVASSVALIGLPDSTAMRRGLSLGDHLLQQCAGPRGDRRWVGEGAAQGEG